MSIFVELSPKAWTVLEVCLGFGANCISAVGGFSEISCYGVGFGSADTSWS